MTRHIFRIFSKWLSKSNFCLLFAWLRMVASTFNWKIYCDVHESHIPMGIPKLTALTSPPASIVFFLSTAAKLILRVQIWLTYLPIHYDRRQSTIPIGKLVLQLKLHSGINESLTLPRLLAFFTKSLQILYCTQRAIAWNIRISNGVCQ